jgi:carbon-monoxide dehydrogenase medium subunit
MKPAPFDYYSPASIDEALSHLSEHGYDAKLIAGGQSLIPMMNFRLAEPSILIDLNRIDALAYIEPNGKDGLRIGAMTRHHALETDPQIAEHAPLLYEVMPLIASPQIRSRGTIGGSLAHADPSAELATLSVALDAEFLLRTKEKTRTVPARDFFVGMFTTLLEPDEMLVEITFPPMTPSTGWSMKEIARRAHDFALVGVAALVSLSDGDTCEGARLVFMSVGDGPVEAPLACEMLAGQSLSTKIFEAAAEKASSEEIDPGGDIHASADFRRHLARVLTVRALGEAFSRAKNGRN